jgi:hypothetical protein
LLSEYVEVSDLLAVALDEGSAPEPCTPAREVEIAAALEEVVVPAFTAHGASPCGDAEPPVAGSCEEPSAKEEVAREVETLEVVEAVVPEVCCFPCADWQAANRYRCLKKDPPLAASLSVGSTGAPEEAGGKTGNTSV